MRLRWTVEALSDLDRLRDFLAPVNPAAAARIVRMLRVAPARLRDHPRVGLRLSEHDPREIRRLIAGDYEIRYELKDQSVVILGLWHTREDR